MTDKRQIYKRTTRGGILELLRGAASRNVTAKEQCSIHGVWEGQ
jgi:desulfoferrodoxin (superoxide reductase-like protein)